MKLTAKKTQLIFKKNDTIAIFISEENVKDINKTFPDELGYILNNIDLDFL